jgi:hypothetical protein
MPPEDSLFLVKLAFRIVLPVRRIALWGERLENDFAPDEDTRLSDVVAGLN